MKFSGTVASPNPEPYKPLDIEQMKTLLKRAEEERKDAPEAYLFAESTLEKFREQMDAPRAQDLPAESSRFSFHLFFGIPKLFGTPIFSIPDCDARLVPINLKEVKDGERVKFMGTDNILAGSIESIQKIMNWLDSLIKPGE